MASLPAKKGKFSRSKLKPRQPIHLQAQGIMDLFNDLGEITAPTVAARTINKVATRITSQAVPKAAKMASVDPYHIRRKMPHKAQHKARPYNPAGKEPRAKITVMRGDMSAISLFMAVRKSRAKNNMTLKGKLNVAAIHSAAKQGKNQKGVTVGKGRYSRSIPGAFIQNGIKRATNPAYNNHVVQNLGAGANVLKGKHYQVLKRKGKKPYPLDVLKIPLAKAVTHAFGKTARDMYRPGGLASQLFEHEVKREIKKLTGVSL
jgi:hypothetical protein